MKAVEAVAGKPPPRTATHCLAAGPASTAAAPLRRSRLGMPPMFVFAPVARSKTAGEIPELPVRVPV